MRVIVPATPAGLHPATVPAILRDGYTPEVWPMLHPESYWSAFLLLWCAREDFCIVEHDVEVPPDALASFERCAKDWCAFSYEVYAGTLAEKYGGAYGFGCVRFRRQLLEAVPDAVVRAGAMNLHPVHPPRSYAVMDSTLTRALRRDGYEPCRHGPNAIHHHDYRRGGA